MELVIAVHVDDNITTADEFTRNVNLREGWPVAKIMMMMLMMMIGKKPRSDLLVSLMKNGSLEDETYEYCLT